jgi:hypothetical protein
LSLLAASCGRFGLAARAGRSLDAGLASGTDMSTVILEAPYFRRYRANLLARRLLAVAWMSILIGLALELSLVVLSAMLGGRTDIRIFIADAAQKVSWSVFVCAGLTLGTASARSLRASAMGALGLFSAPAAFLAAKMIHRSVTQGLGLEPSTGPSPLVVAAIKAIEYGALGLIGGWLSTKVWAGIWTHAALGLGIGVAFGGALIWYVVATAANAPSVAALTGVAVNELVYPAGCAVILFTAGALGEQLACE